MADEPNDFEAIVSKEQMPNCPLCGFPLALPFKPMVFVAHGRAALAHDQCRPAQQTR